MGEESGEPSGQQPGAGWQGSPECCIGPVAPTEHMQESLCVGGAGIVHWINLELDVLV